MLRNYTLVTDDVDLAKQSDREGRVEVENGEKEKKEEGGGGDGKGSQRGKRGLLGISCGSGGQALVGVSFFSNTHTKSILLLGFSAPGTGWLSSFSSFYLL